MTEIDELGGAVYNDFQGAQDVRRETITYVTHCLGFEISKPLVKPTNKIILDFKVVGDALCKVFTLGQYATLHG